MAASAFAFVPTSALILRNDAAAAANNILANESLFRLSFVAELVAGLCYVGVTVLLYEPVSRSLSLLAAFFGLGGVAIGGPAFLSLNSSPTTDVNEAYNPRTFGRRGRAPASSDGVVERLMRW